MESSTNGRITVVLFSFGFKYGVPVDVNFLWDVRFLPNPYWDGRLRPMTGRQPEVADFVIQSEEGKSFLKLLEPLLRTVVGCRQGGKSKTLRIGIGCTGGRHRSVAVAEHLRVRLTEENIDVRLFHRDIDKDEQRLQAKM